MTNRIQKIFNKLKAENKKAFVSFSVGGYPDEATSLEIAKSIADSGAHIHEISFPHAEAQADGPIIQLANIESIDKGINLKKIINIAKEVRNHNSEIGLCLMGYLNNLFIYGFSKFVKDISGVIDAVICVDLPTDVIEEKQLRHTLQKENIALIKLITPTTSDERIKEIVQDAEGFIYSVNVEGQSDVKIFSKSNADGIVLGSAIVKEIQKKIKDSKDKHIVANFIKDYCKKLINNLNK